jgi:hypothetical protein
VNVGRNYNGPKVKIAALTKSGYMLENLSIPRYQWSAAVLGRSNLHRENALGAGNQQERLRPLINTLL